jgi:hypothetical protein
MTEKQYTSQMEHVLKRMQSDIKELHTLTDEFKEQHPDRKYESVVGWRTKLDKMLEDLSFIQPYVEDILNGNAINHTISHKTSGYDKSRTRKVRKAYSYNE